MWGVADYPVGASTDLSHVVFERSSTEKKEEPVSEWVNGKVTSVSVANDGKSMERQCRSDALWAGFMRHSCVARGIG